jgi:succinyl-CoA synthetase beta subunit
VVKAQIHAGGRGAGRFRGDEQGKGGVRGVRAVEDVGAEAKAMLGATLVTKQTGLTGREVKRVYIEEGCDISRELYLSLLVDRASSRITIIASTEGGMDIEKVAAETPGKILGIVIDPATGMQPFHARRIAYALGLSGKAVGSAVQLLRALYDAFVDLDASLIEVNPLVVTAGGDVMALDAKMTFDDNALFRHKDIEELRDESEEDPMEIEAGRHGLNYVKLDGNIGCMVNGAGLAMATMDIIKLYGGEPANFLDVGGGASRERVTAAFKLILSDPNVEGILVNIFGGIMRCDTIAEGVVAAAREVSLHVPLVVRLEGTNVDLGKKILAESGLAILSADNLADAAEKIVGAVREAA